MAFCYNRPPRMLDAALRTSLLAAACCGAALPAAGQQRIAFVVAAPAAAGWRDLAMLPAVAAATVA